MESLGANSVAVRQESTAASNDRRRRLRHKVRTTEYVRLNGVPGNSGQVLDISEDGLCIQSSHPLEVGQAVDLRFDLSESRGPIQATGRVIWSGPLGRTGVRFFGMAEAAIRQLKEWVFLNLLASTDPRRKSAKEDSFADSAGRGGAREVDQAEPVPPNHTDLLAALGAVKRELRMLGPDLDRSLQLIAQRALTFTSATGAAIALMTDGGGMLCRASAGPQAPPLGARVRSDSGFSGDCLRSQGPVCCDDSETDTRVDRETCRALGIRSLAGERICHDGGVVGLIEVFSPNPGTFRADANLVLRNLGEAVAVAIKRAVSPDGAQNSMPGGHEISVDELWASISREMLPRREHFRSTKVIRVLVVAAVAGLAVWGYGRWKLRSNFSQTASSVRTDLERPSGTAVGPRPSGNAAVSEALPQGIDGLRALAERGDADAQYALGRHYATGDDVAQDYDQAAHWFALSAQQGNARAQEALGSYYYHGRGVPTDFVQAYFWLSLAQAGGRHSGELLFPMLTSRMTREQILKAQGQAEDWLKRHGISSKPPSGPVAQDQP